MSIEIRSATADESRRVISTILAAFITDPILRFAWPSPHSYFQSMPMATQALAGDSFTHGTAYVSVDFCGAALWLPPGIHPKLETLERVFRDTAEPGNLDELLATLEKMSQSHPKEPHWYLAQAGVEPTAQGRGIGGALMRHSLKRCDQEGTLAYLESSSPQSISLYKRSGFEVIGEIQIGSGPLVTPMLRQPR